MGLLSTGPTPSSLSIFAYNYIKHTAFFIGSLTDPFPPTALRHCHAQTVRDRSSSYKTGYEIVIKNFLHPKGHQSPISGSKVMVTLPNGWILPIGGASAGEGLRSAGLSRQVITTTVVVRNYN